MLKVATAVAMVAAVEFAEEIFRAGKSRELVASLADLRKNSRSSAR